MRNHELSFRQEFHDWRNLGSTFARTRQRVREKPGFLSR
jgi:hypothetical protein